MQGNYVPGFGISAMPSVHVAMATLFAIGGFVMHRWIGWLMTAYAILIWIGSIYLGWHYATDGIVGASMTIGLWKLSGKLAEPFEERLKRS
jgi:membrane-associated phospholipid phosphatase